MIRIFDATAVKTYASGDGRLVVRGVYRTLTGWIDRKRQVSRLCVTSVHCRRWSERSSSADSIMNTVGSDLRQGHGVIKLRRRSAIGTPHRPHEGGRSSRPVLAQRPCRRRRQRHPNRRRPQLPWHPGLAERAFALNLPRSVGHANRPTDPQSGFLTIEFASFTRKASRQPSHKARPT